MTNNDKKTAGQSLKIETRKIESLIKYDNNPRVIDKAIPQVAESIKQCGYITPIVVDEDNIILAGHTRYEALRSNGITECDVIIVDNLTEEQKKKYRVLDNKTGEIAKWDKAKLKEELADIDFNGFDFGQCVVDTRSFNESGDFPGNDGEKNRSVVCPRCKAEVLI